MKIVLVKNYNIAFKKNDFLIIILFLVFSPDDTETGLRAHAMTTEAELELTLDVGLYECEVIHRRTERKVEIFFIIGRGKCLVKQQPQNEGLSLNGLLEYPSQW